MALSPDQQAMLQLLLERGQSYADLGSVLGVSEAEMRTRARAALSELGGADPDRNVGLTDYLLGQADPIGRADAVRHIKDDPEDLALATELSQKLRLLAPQGELPRLPGEERRPRPRRRPSVGRPRLRLPGRLRRERAAPGGEEDTAAAGPRIRTTLSQAQTRLIVGLLCAAVLVTVVVLGVTGTFSSGSSGSTSASTTGSTTSTPAQSLANVKLKAQGGQSGAGSVNFGLANGQTVFADVKLRGLKFPPTNQTYVVWLLLTPTQGYPLSPIPPCPSNQACLAKNGSFSTRFPIPPAIIPVLARVQQVNVSLAPVKAVQSAIATALKKANKGQPKIILTRLGTSVLQGAIPKASGASGG
jgi:hypothetical protein